MALSEAECRSCRSELAELKARYEGAGGIPDVAKGRLGELASVLERECPSEPGGSLGVALAGLAFAGLVAGVWLWSRQ
ncbi:hypothetical protein ES703_48911 [subsurface metagenome]